MSITRFRLIPRNDSGVPREGAEVPVELCLPANKREDDSGIGLCGVTDFHH